MLGFAAADQERAAFGYRGLLAVAVTGVVGLERAARRRAPASAIDEEPGRVPVDAAR